MLSFSFYVDLPIATVALAAFLANFQSFAHSKNIDTSVDLIAKLPHAKFRVIALFLALLTICWLANIGMWVVLIAIFFIGLIPTIIIADQSDGVILLAAAALVREWAFGFPTMVLRPTPEKQNENHEMIGKMGVVTSPLKPSGLVTIDNRQIQAVSDGGEYIESGLEISVTGIRNGVPTVRKVDKASSNKQQLSLQ